MFALGVLHCSYPCCGISAPREVSQGKMTTVVLPESADFILLPLNRPGVRLIRFSADLTILLLMRSRPSSECDVSY